MFHTAKEKSSFNLILLQIDLDTANADHQLPCKSCNGKLNWANYPRKSRGLEGREQQIRFSLCCSVDGCRKRHLPNSVRFFGRYVFLLFIFVLTSSAVQDKSIKQVANDFSVSRQTIVRWRHYWQAIFPSSKAWKVIRAMFAIPPSVSTLPYGILEILGRALDETASMLKLLKLISEHSE